MIEVPLHSRSGSDERSEDGREFEGGGRGAVREAGIYRLPLDVFV